MWTSYSSAVVRTRSALPVFLYMLLCCTTINVYANWRGQVVVLLIILCCKLILNTYRQEDTTEESFLCGIMIALSALLQPETAFFMLFLWLGLYIQRALGIKSVMASIVGIAVVAIYFALAAYFNFVCLCEWETISTHQWTFSVINILVSAWGLLLFMGSMVRFSETGNSIQSFIMFFSAILLFAIVFLYRSNPDFSHLLPLAFVSVAALSTHYFSSRETVFSGICFLLQIATFIGFYFYCLLA